MIPYTVTANEVPEPEEPEQVYLSYIKQTSTGLNWYDELMFFSLSQVDEMEIMIKDYSISLNVTEEQVIESHRQSSRSRAICRDYGLIEEVVSNTSSTLVFEIQNRCAEHEKDKVEWQVVKMVIEQDAWRINSILNLGAPPDEIDDFEY